MVELLNGRWSTNSIISDERGWHLILMSIYFWHLAPTTGFVSVTLFSRSFTLNALSERNLDSSERNCEGRCLGTNQSITATTLVQVLTKKVQCTSHINKSVKTEQRESYSVIMTEAQCNMWVAFIAGSRLALRVLWFSSLHENQHPKF